MEPTIKSVTWEAPEHTHPDKGGDWYFALGIITLAVVIASIIFGNFLFAILAALSGASIAVAASQSPRIVRYGVGTRGIVVDNALYPFSSLRSYYISEDDIRGPKLLILSDKALASVVVMPIPPEYVDEIDDILSTRVVEEYIEEPTFNRLLEIFGF
jgi:hypothetical protein